MRINRDTCEIKIKNWRKYHPKAMSHSAPWVKITAGIFDDKVWVHLPIVSIAVWLRLLCMCARQNSDSISFAVRVLASELRMKPFELRMHIDSFEQYQLLTVVQRTWTKGEISGTKRANSEKSREEKSREEKSSKAPLTPEPEPAKLETQPAQSDAKLPTKSESKTAQTWECYSTAYRKRYGSDPVRNATTNSQMASFVKRIGETEAPEVAAYFLMLNDPYYARQGHSVGALLRDCEKVRTMCMTGRQTTNIDSKTAQLSDQWARLQGKELK